LYRGSVHAAPHADGRVSGNRYDRNLKRSPSGGHLAGALVLPVGAHRTSCHRLPHIDHVPDGNPLKGSGLHLLADLLRSLVIVQGDDGLAPPGFDPGAVNLSDDLVPVMVKEQDPDIVKPGQVDGLRIMIQDFHPEPALVRLLRRERQLKLPFVVGGANPCNLPDQLIIRPRKRPARSWTRRLLLPE